MKTIPTKTTYLEMLAPRMPPALLPTGLSAEDVRIEQWPAPSVDAYRKLYRGVGDAFHWVDRLLMPADSLARILNDSLVEVHVLTVRGETAGYAELDRRQAGEVELAYFGLFPPYVGQGLGKYLLVRALEFAWSHQPRRVWVHTCDLDHPAALGNYLKAGFTIYDQRIIQQSLPGG